ncbi:hypothetical protein F8388_007637 [Cannabis sativa]|uniref:Uncharacterized protein n=1 Tax=Cannabis sativa TaxID=3483 RepID=A0A7J6ET87_CANSA|nr:hypothetical protein F8388_007637 [Cannabis sativa]
MQIAILRCTTGRIRVNPCLDFGHGHSFGLGEGTEPSSSHVAHSCDRSLLSSLSELLCTTPPPPPPPSSSSSSICARLGENLSLCLRHQLLRSFSFPPILDSIIADCHLSLKYRRKVPFSIQRSKNRRDKS